MLHRRYDPALTYLVTLTTVDRRWCLCPDDAEFQLEIIGALGVAQQATGARVHGFTFMSNHYHGLFSADCPEQFAAFLCQFHAAIARLVNRRYQRSGPVWRPRSDVLPVLPGEKSELEAMRYLLGQAPKAGAAAHPLDWSGASSAAALLTGAPLVGRHFDRTAWTLAGRNGKDPGSKEDYTCDVAVQVTPLPSLARWEPVARQAVLRDLADEVAVFHGGRARWASEQAGAPAVPSSENARHSASEEHFNRFSSAADAAQAWSQLRVSPAPERRPKRLCIAPSKDAEEAYQTVVDDFEEAYSESQRQLRAGSALVAKGEAAALVAFPLYGFAAPARALPLWHHRKQPMINE